MAVEPNNDPRHQSDVQTLYDLFVDGPMDPSVPMIFIAFALILDGSHSASELTRKLPRSRTTVHRALNDLLETGLVEQKVVFDDSGRRTVYEVTEDFRSEYGELFKD